MHRSKTSWAPSSVATGVADFQEQRLPVTWDGVDTRLETIRPSKSIPKQLMPAWFVCTTNGPLVALTASLFHETQSWRLSLRRHGCAVGRSGQNLPMPQNRGSSWHPSNDSSALKTDSTTPQKRRATSS